MGNTCSFEIDAKDCCVNAVSEGEVLPAEEFFTRAGDSVEQPRLPDSRLSSPYNSSAESIQKASQDEASNSEPRSSFSQMANTVQQVESLATTPTRLLSNMSS